MNFEWLVLVVPIGISGYACLKYGDRIAALGFPVMLAVCLATMGLLRVALVLDLESDTEFRVEYCTHAKHQLASTAIAAVPIWTDRGTALSPRTVRSPDKWEVTGSEGGRASVTQEEYERLRNLWNWKTRVGDNECSMWPGSKETSVFLFTERRYVNPLTLTRKFYGFPEVKPKDIAGYGLHPYPSTEFPLTGKRILGSGGSTLGNRQEADFMLKHLNSTKGRQQNFQCWILLFPGQPIEAAILQEALWDGGNLNEFVLCIGTDEDENVNWMKAFSWTPERALVDHLNRRSNGREPLDLVNVATELEQLLTGAWKVREVSEFPVLEVELPFGAMLLVCAATWVLGYVFASVARDRKYRASLSKELFIHEP